MVYQGEMWVIGGRKDNKEDRPDGSPKIIRSVEAFNPRTGKWRKIRSLAHPRLGHVAGVVGNKVIVAGGCGRRGAEGPRARWRRPYPAAILRRPPALQ